jgi:HAD superfamily hydrolase (TIGR01549 family)
VKTIKRIKHLCFDLDGTLMDSLTTIYRTTLKTLDILKIENSLPEAELKNRIGYHFSDIFRELKIPVADVEHFINVYKQMYFNYIDDSRIYPGVIEVLKYLKKNNYRVSLLTTKAQDQAEKITEYFRLSDYFNLLMGGRPGIAVKPSPEPLIKICNELNIQPAATLMIGDAEIDIACGKNARALTCAALYGYRERDKLFEMNPDFVVEDIKEITSIIGE